MTESLPTTTVVVVPPDKERQCSSSRSTISAPANSHLVTSLPTTPTTPSPRVMREYCNVTENVTRKKKVVSETIERTVTIPEVVFHEEEYDEIEVVREKVIEVAKPVIKEVFVDVPQVEYREEVVEYEDRRIEERVKNVEKLEIQEVINYIPVTQTRDKIVEVHKVQYVDVAVEKIVEVPEYREEVVIVEKVVPRYVDRIVEKLVDVEVVEEVDRVVPRAVQHVVQQQFNLPTITSRYERVPVTLYVPKFIEIPVPAEMLTESSLRAAERLLAAVERVNTMAYPSLCELEELAAQAKNFQLDIEEDPEKRFNQLAHHLDTNAIVVNSQKGDVVGRKISVNISTRDH
eukprot:GHVH01011792.1.p1 GENE.GHVH01011792.1~~GHVH01011792.1.p1  ORF type:complete len:346 (-),score=56.47 GHVH01011792.1:277-1314(-)